MGRHRRNKHKNKRHNIDECWMELMKWYEFYSIPIPPFFLDFLRGHGHGNHRSTYWNNPLGPFVMEFRRKFKNYKIPRIPQYNDDTSDKETDVEMEPMPLSIGSAQMDQHEDTTGKSVWQRLGFATKKKNPLKQIQKRSSSNYIFKQHYRVYKRNVISSNSCLRVYKLEDIFGNPIFQDVNNNVDNAATGRPISPKPKAVWYDPTILTSNHTKSEGEDVVTLFPECLDSLDHKLMSMKMIPGAVTTD